jgi:hypothetical protein
VVSVTDPYGRILDFLDRNDIYVYTRIVYMSLSQGGEKAVVWLVEAICYKPEGSWFDFL